jgi:hypothetical protein
MRLFLGCNLVVAKQFIFNWSFGTGQNRQEKGTEKGRWNSGHRKKEIIVICETIWMQHPPRHSLEAAERG